MNLILCGMPRCGKSTLGKAVAEKLGCCFIDIDKEMERAHGCPVAELYQSLGETAFRQKEHRVIAALAPLKPSVIALGGGSLNLVENIYILKTLGTLVYLKLSSGPLLERLAQNPLIFLKPQDLEQLMQKRGPIYEEAAEYICELPLAPIEVQVSALLSSIQGGSYG